MSKMALVQASATTTLLKHADSTRIAIRKTLKKQKQMEQYFTSAPIAGFMASMMSYSGRKHVRLLDPGAGIGSLASACIDRICMMPDGSKPRSVALTMYEMDGGLTGHLTDMAKMAGLQCKDRGIDFSCDIKNEDFIAECCPGLPSRGAGAKDDFTHVIINPPYGKIRAGSEAHEHLSTAGLSSTNQYAAFVGISMRMMAPSGQIVFITPRSFCNGAYFHRFRSEFLGMMRLKRLHLFNSRTASFADDGVLQENVIVSAQRKKAERVRWNKVVADAGATVLVSASSAPGTAMVRRRCPLSDLVIPDDVKKFIHIVPDKWGAKISRHMRRGLKHTLGDIGASVSTGRVVDFRARDALRVEEGGSAVPLVRPFNIASDGVMTFPVAHRKHHSFILADAASTRNLLVPNSGSYVLVKRFTTKEQKRRITAAVWSAGSYPSDLVGFENRINYFHSSGRGLSPDIAAGIWAFLSSTMVDAYFRQFNGSTQVNAADLRYLRYPSTSRLRRLGSAAEYGMPQDEIDGLVDRLAFGEM